MSSSLNSMVRAKLRMIQANVSDSIEALGQMQTPQISTNPTENKISEKRELRFSDVLAWNEFLQANSLGEVRLYIKGVVNKYKGESSKLLLRVQESLDAKRAPINAPIDRVLKACQALQVQLAILVEYKDRVVEQDGIITLEQLRSKTNTPEFNAWYAKYEAESKKAASEFWHTLAIEHPPRNVWDSTRGTWKS